jgi:hypothetical protein
MVRPPTRTRIVQRQINKFGSDALQQREDVPNACLPLGRQPMRWYRLFSGNLSCF